MHIDYETLDEILMNNKAKIPKQFPLETYINSASRVYRTYLEKLKLPEPKETKFWRRRRVYRHYTYPKILKDILDKKPVLPRNIYITNKEYRQKLMIDSRTLGNSYSEQNQALFKYYKYISNQMNSVDKSKSLEENKKNRVGQTDKVLHKYWKKRINIVEQDRPHIWCSISNTKPKRIISGSNNVNTRPNTRDSVRLPNMSPLSMNNSVKKMKSSARNLQKMYNDRFTIESRDPVLVPPKKTSVECSKRANVMKNGFGDISCVNEVKSPIHLKAENDSGDFLSNSNTETTVRDNTPSILRKNSTKSYLSCAQQNSCASSSFYLSISTDTLLDSVNFKHDTTMQNTHSYTSKINSNNFWGRVEDAVSLYSSAYASDYESNVNQRNDSKSSLSCNLSVDTEMSDDGQKENSQTNRQGSRQSTSSKSSHHCNFNNICKSQLKNIPIICKVLDDNIHCERYFTELSHIYNEAKAKDSSDNIANLTEMIIKHSLGYITESSPNVC